MQSIRQSVEVQRAAADLVQVQGARIPRRKAHGLQMKRNAEIERDRQPPEV
jgi:hypothetical protein